jgi:hypothetical protein
MNRVPRHTRGTVSFEQIFLVSAVGLVASGSFLALGRGMERDIGAAADGRGAPTPVLASQAGETSAGAPAAAGSALGAQAGEWRDPPPISPVVVAAGEAAAAFFEANRVPPTPTNLVEPPSDACDSFFSACTFRKTASFVLDLPVIGLASDFTVGMFDGVFWRGFENLRRGASPLEWLRDGIVDVATLPLQLSGNFLSEAQEVAGRAVSFMGGFVGWLTGAEPPKEGGHRGLPDLGDDEATLYSDARGEGADIAPGDVDQGTLGDCVALAGFAAVAAQNPELIRNAIRDNGDGTYTVTFWKQREPGHIWEPEWTTETVTVDAKVPLDEKGRPIYADVNDGELWVAILEKAWAETRGGYQAINGDASFGPLEALTGRTSTTNVGLPFMSRAPSKQDLVRMWNDGYAMVAGNGKLGGSDKAPKGHQMYVLDVAADGTVTLGNPWGIGQEVTLSYEQFTNDFAVNYAPTRREVTPSIL